MKKTYDQMIDEEIMRRIEELGPFDRTYVELRREALEEVGSQEHAAEGPLTIEMAAEACRKVFGSDVPTAGSAAKNDSNKPQLSLVPREALELMAKGFGYGAAKYGRYNFERGHHWSRVLDAALRHLYAVAAGEFTDAESGNPHLAHALCSLAMLAYNMDKYPELDDISRNRGAGK